MIDTFSMLPKQEKNKTQNWGKKKKKNNNKEQQVLCEIL